MSRSAIRIVMGVVVTLVVLVAVAGGLAWWKLASLKSSLIAQLGNELGAQVQISSLSLDPWNGEVRAAGISLINLRPSTPWQQAQIGQAVLHFHAGDLLSPQMPVRLEVSSWSIVMQPSASEGATPNTSAADADMTSPYPTPRGGRIELTDLSAQQGSVEIDLSGGRKVSLQGVAFDASNNGAGVWTTQVQASSVNAATLQAGASSVQIRIEEDRVTFSDLRMTCGGGLLTGSGDADLSDQHTVHADLKAVEIPVEMLVSLEWQMKLSGSVSGEVHFLGGDGAGEASGHLTVNHGKFNVMPWLGQLTAMVGLQDISNVEVDQATSDLGWKDGAIHLTNIDIRKNGAMRVAGAVDIDAAGIVDGHLKLGLPSSITAKWPQLQTQVFSVQSDDYNWADVHLTGQPDHLQEDLSPRLLAAGMGQGGQLIDQAAQKASDLLKGFLGK